PRAAHLGAPYRRCELGVLGIELALDLVEQPLLMLGEWHLSSSGTALSGASRAPDRISSWTLTAPGSGCHPPGYEHCAPPTTRSQLPAGLFPATTTQQSTRRTDRDQHHLSSGDNSEAGRTAAEPNLDRASSAARSASRHRGSAVSEGV